MPKINEPKQNVAQFYIDEIVRLRQCLAEEEKKPFWKQEKKNNIGFWHGCIVQTKSIAQCVLSFEDYQKVRVV